MPKNRTPTCSNQLTPPCPASAHMTLIMTSRFHLRLIDCLQRKGSGRPQPAVCCRLLAPGSLMHLATSIRRRAPLSKLPVRSAAPLRTRRPTPCCCAHDYTLLPLLDGKACVPKFRKAVWRDCLQAHWDEEHRGVVAMPDATTTAI